MRTSLGEWEDQFFRGPPDIIGTVRGYRHWRMNEIGHLYSPWREYRWWLGLNTANCLVGHRAPFPSCTCGFYSHYLPSSVIGGYHSVYGVIECQGAIELQSKGLRAEQARIVALSANGRQRRALLRENYPDVQIFRTRGAMWRAYPPAKEVCGVPTHRIRRRWRPLRLVACGMNGFLWAQFGPQIAQDWTNVFYPLIFSVLVIALSMLIG